MARKVGAAKPITMPEVGENCTSGTTGCQIQELFRLFGKTHTLDILHLFVVQEEDHTLRFIEVQKALKISPNTLSERLKELLAVGLLSRHAFQEIPPRVDYKATKKARDLDPVFEELKNWSQRNDLTTPAPEPATATA